MSVLRDLNELLDHRAVFVMLLGALLVVLAASGGTPYLYVEIRDPTWKFLLGVLGGLMLLLGLASALFGLRSRGVEARALKFRLRISTPPGGIVLPPGRHPVSGTYVKRPPDGSILLVNLSRDGSRLWPQVPADFSFDTTAKTWTGRVWVDEGTDGQVGIAVVGPSARVLVNYYRDVGETSRQWHPLTQLPPDLVICDHAPIRTSN